MTRLQICAAIGIALFAPAPSMPAQQLSPLDLCLIDALDEHVQARFKEVDQYFGFRRIVRPGETAHRFRPENARELETVSDLERARLHVVLYLAGRGVLGPRATDPWNLTRIVKGPALVTPGLNKPDAAPEPMDLWDEARSSLAAFDRTDSREFTLGGWTFSARPVRASDQTCLTCHRDESLHLGDPVGAVLYGFRRR